MKIFIYLMFVTIVMLGCDSEPQVSEARKISLDQTGICMGWQYAFLDDSSREESKRAANEVHEGVLAVLNQSERKLLDEGYEAGQKVYKEEGRLANARTLAEQISISRRNAQTVKSCGNKILAFLQAATSD